jgi:hypothetical protein
MGSRGQQISKPIYSDFEPNLLNGPLGEHNRILIIKVGANSSMCKGLGAVMKNEKQGFGAKSQGHGAKSYI